MWMWAKALIIAVGLIAVYVGQTRPDPKTPAEASKASFWSVEPATAADVDGISLEGATLTVTSDLRPNSRFQRLGLRVVPAGPEGRVTLMIAPLGRRSPAWQVRAAWSDALRVAVAAVREDGTTEDLARSPPLSALSVGLPVLLVVEMEQGKLRVALDDQQIASARDEQIEPGRFQVMTRGSGARVRSIDVRGTIDGQPFRHRELFSRGGAGPSEQNVGGWRRAAVGLASVAGALLFLISLCELRPRRRELIGASLNVGAGFALLPIAARFGAPAFHPIALGATAFVALTAGLFALRGALVPGEGRAEAIARWVPVTICILVATPSLAWLGWSRVGFERALIERDVRRAEGVVDRAVDMPRAKVTLGPHNSLQIQRTARSFELRTNVSLEPGSILEVRLRAHESRPQGVALFLSADKEQPTGFYHQSATSHRSLGACSGAVAAGAPLALRVRVDERHFTAWVNGDRVASGRDPYLSVGGIHLLAARGRVEVDGYSTSPVPQGSSVRGEIAREALVAVAKPGVSWLLLAILVGWLARIPWRTALGATGFVLPLIALASRRLGDDAVGLDDVLAPIVVAVVLLLLVVQSRGRKVGGVRLGLLLLLVLCVTPAAVWWALFRPVDGNGAMVSSYSDIGDTVVRDHLLYLQHPYARQLNDYLTSHLFRGRRAEGADHRVLALGTSSTWGYGLDPGQDYPSQLEQLLRRARGPSFVEVLNAGWPGTNGTVLLRFLRDALATLEPDVVTLSLYYNDSFALTQWDPEDYFRRICDAGLFGRTVASLRSELDVARGRLRLNQALTKFGSDPEITSLDAWTSCGLPVDDAYPPHRFERLLRRFCELSRERGFHLVLIKEPLAGDGRRIWKDEFYAVMDGLQAAYPDHVTVADPGPKLARIGGEKLFQAGDEIHPTAEGQRLVARHLFASVVALLDRRR